MQSIIDLSINFDVDYVRRHKHQLQYFFDHFQKKYLENIKEPLLAYTISPDQIDEVGTLWVEKRDLDTKSLRLIQTIEDSYMSTAFFSETMKKIGSRGYVYYSSATQDGDGMRAMLRLINHTNTSVELLAELYLHYKDRWEFGIYALLDDIRYKLLIIDECFDTFSHDDLVGRAVNLFYDYLQGTMPEQQVIEDFCHQVNTALVKAIKYPVPLLLRSYKEADNPYQNLTFRDTIIGQLKGTSIDVMVGIRFGGSELPHLLKKYLPEAKIAKVRASNYSKAIEAVDLPSFIKKTDHVLVLDDNILTGRTLAMVVNSLKQRGVRHAYFGCITYSGMKRYPQMIMKGHGVVNTDVLLWSCVVGESQYTKINNSRSYKNSNGVFDKLKAKLQRRMNDKTMRYKL